MMLMLLLLLLMMVVVVVVVVVTKRNDGESRPVDRGVTPYFKLYRVLWGWR